MTVGAVISVSWRSAREVVGVDKVKLAERIGFPGSFGQSRFALSRGNAFEAMLKIWSQEAFPTLLRATAQGTIVGAARVVAAIAAVATPTLMTNAPRATFAVLLGVVSAGLIAGLFVGRTVQRHNHLRDDDTNAQVKGERNIEELT